MPPKPNSRLLAYLIAVLVVPVAIALTFLYQSVFDNTQIFAAFYLAVCISTWYGGRRPGLVTVILSALAIDLGFMTPWIIGVPTVKDSVRLVIYIVVMLLIYWLTAGLYDSHRATEQLGQQQLEQKELLLKQALASDSRHREILEDQTELIVRYLSDSTIVFVNEAYCRYFGQKQENIIGKSYAPIVFEADLEMVNEQVKSITPENPFVTITNRVVVNGEVRWTQWNNRLLNSASDGRWELQAVGRDITPLKQAEEALKHYTQEVEDLYNNAPCGYHSLDIEGKYLRVNDTELKLLGYSREEMIGQPVLNFLPEASRQVFRDNFKVFLSQGHIQNLEFEMICKDGSIVPLLVEATVMKDDQGNYLYSRSTLVDIRDRKKAEEQLRLSAERISLANAELSRAARLKDEFLAGMSHELRTPLNAVLGMSEALLEEINGPLTPGQRKSINLIERSGRHLLTLINDILDLSKIEAGKMELEMSPVNLQSLCKTSLSFVMEIAHNKQIRLTAQVDEGLENAKLDERRIRQVLINLLSNAVKFTPEGGQVELSVRCTPDRETLEFAVSDTGIGIAADQLDKLFQPFMQIDSSLSRRYSGTGLGLSLVRRIVELHGGSITLTSEVNQGSCFTVILPWRFDQSSSENLTSTTPQTNIHHALVVEDSPHTAEQISRYLSSLGVTTVVHPLGQGVMDVVLETQPDLIVLDILLPDLPGWEVLIELKANPLTKNIPVLIISVVDDRPKGLALGAVDYLVKPITRLTLEKTLNRLRGIIEKEPETALIIATHQSSASPLIVLVEDTESNIETIVSYLQAHGFRMAIARNGLEAIQLIKHSDPALVLMDIQIPEIDGLEVIRRVRAYPNLVNLPIIALTALAMPGDREQCLQAGANEYLTKPVSLKQLLQTIRQYLAEDN